MEGGKTTGMGALGSNMEKQCHGNFLEPMQVIVTMTL